MFTGSIVAIVTPFINGEFDEDSYRKLIEFQIAGGTNAIVPCGTTGESTTMTIDEHKKILNVTVDAVKGRIPVIAGTGSNNTREAIELTVHAKKVGADATLQVTPYYNKPTTEGLYQHFKAIAKAAPLPQILYNIPGRTGTNMLPPTIARLAEIPEVVAIKEATGNLSQMIELMEYVGDRLIMICGDDNLTLPVLAIGGKGVISVTANIVPRMNSDMIVAWNQGKYEKAKELFYKLLPLAKAMFIESNPLPVKTALAIKGMIREEFRLPLVTMEKENRDKLIKVLNAY